MKTILITGGIGDVFALDGFMTVSQKESVKSIILATPQARIITTLFSGTDQFFNLQTIKTISLEVHYTAATLNVPKETEDYSISVKFPLLEGAKYQSSSWLRSQPEGNKCLIVPTSQNKYKDRDFTSADWVSTIQLLEKRNQTGIIINPDHQIPRHPLLQTIRSKNILESIKIVNGVSAYIGIDSCLSVLCSRAKIQTIVKTVNPQCVSHREIYYDSKTVLTKKIGD